MGNVIFALMNKINFDATTFDVEVVESLDQVVKKTVVVDPDKFPSYGLEGENVYVPATLLDSVQGKSVKVYHELELYPFFQAAKEIILKDGAPKGVFRLRRVIDGEKSNSIIASDLCVLSSVFGEPERIVIKHSRAGLEPQHVIAMLSFGGGTMAHVDYTFAMEEYVELEWSGVGQIIEFNSEEMNPVEPVESVPVTLQYDVDSILRSSKDLESVREELHRFQQLVGGAEA